MDCKQTCSQNVNTIKVTHSSIQDLGVTSVRLSSSITKKLITIRVQKDQLSIKCGTQN